MLPDIIVVGSGFAGATCARFLAEKGFKLLIIESRTHIAGNMYEEVAPNGILVQKYGPHIFHTSKKEVIEFIKPFSNWFEYSHKVLAKVDGKEIPVPFNFKSLEEIGDKNDIAPTLSKIKKHFPGIAQISIFELLNHQEPLLKKLGNLIYDKIFKNYTAKQWMCPAELVDKSVINRVKVNLNYDDKYFQDNFQMMPTNGFTHLINNMLDHKNISVELKTNACKKLKITKTEILFEDMLYPNPIIYTGSIDELINYRLGELPYRTIDMKNEHHDKKYYQKVATVNYPNEESFTRITEFKYLSNQHSLEKTTIMKEYPKTMDRTKDIPYYPIINDKNKELYNNYKNALSHLSNLYFCGRLGEYKYLNMDDAIANALSTSEKIFERMK